MKLTENINALTTAIDNLPTRQEFKDAKNELKQIVKGEAVIPKKEINEYKKSEKRKRMGYLYG